MAEQNEVVVQFKAVVAGFLDKMGEAHKGTQEATEKIGKSIEGVGHGFEKLMGTMGALGGILAGGAMFKETISKTLEWNGEVIKMSKILGITTEVASGMAVALEHVGVSTDTYTATAMKMTKQMRTNGEAFDKLGVSTKDSNGEWRNSSDVMLDAIEKLNGMQAGTDRNIAAQAMFGARVGNLGPLLRLNAEMLEESAEKAKKYHLVVGPEGAAQTRAYKDSTKDLQLIMKSLEVQLGNALLPVLTKLGQFLGEAGPGMAEGFSYAIKGVVQVFYVLKAVIETITIILTAAISSMIEGWKMVAEVIYNVATGNLKGAVNAASQGAQAIKNEWAAAAEGVTKAWVDMGKNSKELWSDAPKKQSKAPTGDTLGGEDLKSGKMGMGKTNVVAEWEAELQKQKALLAQSDGDLAEMAKEDERKFWLGKLALTKQGSAEWVQIRLKMAEDGKAIQKAADDEAKKADKEASDLAKLTRQDELAAAKNGLEVKRADLAASVAMGHTTRAQELAELKQFYAEELKLEINALLAEQALHKDDPVKFAETQNRILAAKRKSNLDIQKINTQATMEESKLWTKLGQTIQSSLGNAITSIITKTQTVGQALQNLFKSVTDSIVQMLVTMGLEQAKQFLIRKLMGKEAAASDIIAGAGSYAVNAMSSVAAIPITGWAMAPGVGAAAFANAIGYMGSIASAAKGWDIPAGLNPMAQLHSREMVLPEEHADTIRSLKGGSGGSINVSFNGVVDGESFFRNNRVALTKVITSAVRDGQLRRPS